MVPPRLGTLLTAMVTPFAADGTLDLDAAASLARYVVSQGSDGLVVAGSTGEGSSLSDDEKLDLFAAVAEAVTVPVVAGSTSSNTAQSVALTARVAATGAAGVLATTPAYVRPSQSGIASHFAAVADATALPVMLYDIPSRTGRKVASTTAIDVVTRHANVVALKDASGDLPGAAHLAAVLGERLDLYSGDDALVLPFMAVGAVGLVSVAGHWAGPELAVIVDAATRGDWARARAINERVAPSCAFESTEVYPNPLPAKAALRYLGWAVGECRAPLGPGDDELSRRAATVVDDLVASRATSSK